jgi:outer membrane protein
MGKFYNTTLGLLAAAVIGLFILHFTSKNNSSNTAKVSRENTKANLPIAYFDVDSVVANYSFSKLRQTELETLIQKADLEISNLQNGYEAKRKELERTAITPEDRERAMIQLNKLGQENAGKIDAAKANVQNAQQRFEVELKKNIQDYIKKFNSPQRYSFIINDEPGFIYYRDTMLNITKEILSGLNADYKVSGKQ